MAADRIIAEETADAWAQARQGVIEELELLSDEDLDFRPGPESRSIRELVRHIIESEMVLAGETLLPNGDFRRKPWPELAAEHGADAGLANSKDELLTMLGRQADNAARIRAADPAFLAESIHTLFGPMRSRRAMLQFGIAHEFYHRGQLAMCVRLVGVTPALTRKFAAAV